MGGRDKGLLPYGDGVLIGHVIEQVRPQVGALLISANRNRSDYAGFGYPVLEDPLEDFQGPLAGFLAGLERMRTNHLLTLPCDGPLVIPGYAERMAAAMVSNEVDIVVAHDGRRLQPVYTLMHRRVLAGLNQALADGERKIDRWFPMHNWTTADFSDVPAQFVNINTPEDYASVEAGRAEA